MGEFKYVSFFSGLGGFDAGLNQIGGACALAVEWNKLTRKCYELAHGLAPKEDVRDITWRDIPKAKVWTFGFPCQDLSIANTAGKDRKKLEGERSGLFFEIMRLVTEVRENKPENLPMFLWAENVSELGSLLDVVNAEFDRAGYSMQANLYNSKYWGVAQNRPRYHVIGTRKDLESLRDFVIPRENQDLTHVPKLRDFLDDNVADRYLYDLSKYEYEEHPVKEIKAGELNRIGTLSSKGWLDIMKRVYSVEGIAPTLDTCQGGHRQAKVVDNFGRVRRLTAREYLRLQGFPDDLHDKLTANGISASQMYLMAGNAVSVPLIRAIGESLLPYLRENVTQGGDHHRSI